MSEYAECTTCKYVNEKADGEHCKYCTLNACRFTLNYKPMTNADRIRNMTDEELAEYLVEIVKDAVFHSEEYQEWLEWLQAEVKEGENIADS